MKGGEEKMISVTCDRCGNSVEPLKDYNKENFFCEIKIVKLKDKCWNQDVKHVCLDCLKTIEGEFKNAKD